MTRQHRSRAVRMFLALLVVGIWIPLLCTAPQILGNRMWSWIGFETDLPLRHLVRVSLNSIAVIAFLALVGKLRLLRFVRPSRPWVIVLFIPLMALNTLQGSWTDARAALVVVSLAGTMLTGFWEEFLFRGLIQTYLLKPLGPRIHLLATAVLFALIHVNEGLAPVLIAFGIGLPLCVARKHIGLWPLVMIHGVIDFTSAMFDRTWAGYYTFACIVVAIYGIAAFLVMIRSGNPTAAARSQATS